MHNASRFLVTIYSRIMSTLITVVLFAGFAVCGVVRGVESHGPVAPLMSSDSGYLYILNNCTGCANQIFGFRVDETTGALTPLIGVGFPVSTGGNGKSNSLASELLAIDRKNLRLFAVNDGSNSISAFTIDPATGALTALFSPIDLPPPPIQPDAPHWSTTAVRPSGSDSLLVIGDIGLTVGGGRLASYKITPTTATAAAESPFTTGLANPLSTAFTQDGGFVYAGGGASSKIAAFRSIDAEGGLELINGSAFESGRENPSGYATDAENRLFVVSRPFSRPRIYNTANGGAPVFVSGLTITDAADGGPAVLHPDKTFYLAAERAGSGVSVFQINGSDISTVLTKVKGSPFRSGGSSVSLVALNRTGTVLFAANNNEHNLTTFDLDSAGVLAIKATQPVNTLCSQAGVPCALGGLNGIAYLPPFVTTTTISAPPIIFGQNGVVTVTVSSAAGAPSGNVSLSVDGGALVTQALSGGTATFIVCQPNVGAHSLRTTFTETGFTPSNGDGTLNVQAAQTTATISAPVVTLGFPPGQSVPIVVTISSALVSPSGIVNLTLDGRPPLSLTFSGGLATFNLVAPTAGTHVLRASFDSQGGFAGSTSTAKLIVNPIPVPVSTDMSISARAVTAPQDASVVVTITSACGIPSGRVALQVDGGAALTRVLSGGKATFIFRKPIGSHLLLARFTGTVDFAPSQGTAILVVKPPVHQ